MLFYHWSCDEKCCNQTGKVFFKNFFFYVHAAKPKTPKSSLKSGKQQLSQFDSPVFFSDPDDDCDVVIKSTWRTRHSRPSSQEKDAPAKENKPRNAPYFPSPLASDHTPKPSSAPPTRSGWREDTCSSEDEFQSLLDRIRKNQKLVSSSTHGSPKRPGEIRKSVSGVCTVYRWIKVILSFSYVDELNAVICVSDIEPKGATACVTPPVKARKDGERVPFKGSQVTRTPAQLPISRPLSQTEPRAGHSSRYR